MLLAIERSGRVASAALFSAPDSCVAVSECSGAGQGDAWGLVRDALSAAGADPRHDIDAIAVGIGPGSFSGIRSALALAQGLALPRGIPVHGVLTPAAAAFHIRRKSPNLPPVRVFGDARRGHAWMFEEKVDVKNLSHNVKDLRLLSLDDPESGLPPFSEVVAESGFHLACADSERMEKWFSAAGVGGVMSLCASAEDIAAMYFVGSFANASPVYLHPAVVQKR